MPPGLTQPEQKLVPGIFPTR